jgi:hypothetical protein
MLTDEERMEQVYNNYMLVEAAAKLANTNMEQGEDDLGIDQLEWLGLFFQDFYKCTIFAEETPMTDPELLANKEELVVDSVYLDFLAFIETLYVLIPGHKFGKRSRQKGKPYNEHLGERGLSVNKDDSEKDQLKQATSWFVNNACVRWQKKQELYFKTGKGPKGKYPK